MSSIVIKNIGTILSGDIDNPILKGDTIVVADGKIAAIGGAEVANGVEAEKVIDAAGSTVTPGLFDTHVHTSLGDYAHRQFASNFIEGELHGGVTTIISAGEVHTPGRPKDPAGTKALAVLAHKSFAALKPGGVKVHGGSLILEKGLVEKDFEELAKEGVWTVGEIGLGSVKDPADAAPMVEWAHKNGMKVQMHTGGTSIPGSSTVTAAQVMATKPDVISHINGGPTATMLPAAPKRRVSWVVLSLETTRLPAPVLSRWVSCATSARSLPFPIFPARLPSAWRPATPPRFMTSSILASSQ